MNKLETHQKIFKMIDCNPSELNLTKKDERLSSTFTVQQIELEKNYLKNNINVDQTVALKEGAQVMCVANIDLEGPLPICNGSRGIIKEFDENGMPIVLFKNGCTRKIDYHVWQSETIPSVAIKQIPLILAWAITIHKSQGASLDLAEIDIGSGIFECGQTYVALSRVTNLEGLYLKSFNPNKITINKKVLDFYEQLS